MRIFLLIGLLLVLEIQSRASVRMLTDRDIYVSGEEVLLSVFLPADCEFKLINLSLTNSQGELIRTVSLPMHEFKADGHLYLPDSLASGSYLITVRSPHINPQMLESREIVVLNRFENTDEPIAVNRAMLPELFELPKSGVSVSGLLPSYPPGEQVNLTLTDPSNNNGVVAVAVSRCLPGWTVLHRDVPVADADAGLLTAREGVVLQGVVLRKGTTEPVSGATVYLSIPDSIPFFDYYQTRSDGRYYFLLPNRYGSEKLVLQAEKGDETDELQLRVEAIGGSKDAGFQVEPMQQNSNTAAYLSESVQLVTFRKIYQAPDLDFQKAVNKPQFPFAFYGQSPIVVDPDEYFELGDFSEISKELLQPVRFRSRKDGYSLDIVDYDLRNYMTGKPMILVDGVPMSDLARLSPMGSKVIERIDVVPYQRFYGDLRMDGVLAIYTKSGDASSIPLSNHLLKLDIEALQTEVKLPDLKKEETEPDFRQLLYWNPDLKVNGGASVQFTTPNVNGTYRVHLLERAADGQLSERTEYFTVSNTL